MRREFDPRSGLIIVPVELEGLNGSVQVKLALDTGATTTVIRPVHLRWLGYSLGPEVARVKMTTGSTVELVPQLCVAKIAALGHERRQFAVLAHALPPTAPIDGLLGLDFLRRTRLELDFRDGFVNLSA